MLVSKDEEIASLTEKNEATAKEVLQYESNKSVSESEMNNLKDEIEKLKQKQVELTLESETQEDLLKHQQNQINSQNKEI